MPALELGVIALPSPKQKSSLQPARAMLKYSLMQMAEASSDSGQQIYSREKGKKMDLQIGRQVAGSLFHWQYWSAYFMGY